MEKVIGLFPGQGSQKVGMGKDHFTQYELAKRRFAEADEALGIPLSQICFEGPSERLTLTEITQPAILTVSTIAFEVAVELGMDRGLSAAAGHSLGEYSALVAAGSLKFQDAVQLVHKRGRYMQEAVPAGAGKMAAILGKELVEIESAIAQVKDGLVEIANINAPGQIVVAGDVKGVTALGALLSGAKFMELPVSAPFHCSLMKPARDRLKEDLQKIKITKPTFPIYHNVDAQSSMDPEILREKLIEQVCGRVRWIDCMTNAISEHQITKSIEFGGSVLSGMLKRINGTIVRELR